MSDYEITGDFLEVDGTMYNIPMTLNCDNDAYHVKKVAKCLFEEVKRLRGEEDD